MKRLIFYDLDGTLVNTERDIAQAVNHMLAHLGANPLSSEVIRRFVGRGLLDLVAYSLETDDPVLLERGTKLFEDYYREHLADFSVLYPGAQELLAYFSDRKQAVLTNKPNPFAQELLAALGVADRFIEVLAGGSGYPKKPDPAGMLAFMDQHGISRTEALFIGDSLIDVETGRNGGVQTVVITHGFSDEAELREGSPDLLVHDFQELLQLARRRGW